MEFLAALQNKHDELKPSLFEILSEQQLNALLPPSLRYLLAVATYRHPRYLIHILNNFDEAYAVLAFAVESYYLRTYHGTFTENFYGMKRARILLPRPHELPRAQIAAPSQVRHSLRLRRRDIYANLALVIVLPYIKRKLDEAHDIHAPAASAVLLGPQYTQSTSLPPDATLRQRILHYYKWFLRNVYPHINAAYYTACLAFQLAYLFDGTKQHDPFLWLIGMRMRRLGEADYRAFEAASASAPSSPSSKSKTPAPRPALTSLLHPRAIANTVAPRLLDSMKILLPTSIFALKFLEWWHASDFARQLSRKAAEGLELPPPVVGWLPTNSTRESLGKKTQTTDKDKKKSASPPSAVKGRKEGRTSTDTISSRGKGPQTQLDNLTNPPISSTSHLPIFTVSLPTKPKDGSTRGKNGTVSEDHDHEIDSSLCPICLGPIVTATASPYGHVYCYVCIHKWVEGNHERQIKFMEGGIEGSSEIGDDANVWDESSEKEQKEGSREGRWESGLGRDAVSGRRCLGGTESLRRVVV